MKKQQGLVKKLMNGYYRRDYIKVRLEEIIDITDYHEERFKFTPILTKVILRIGNYDNIVAMLDWDQAKGLANQLLTNYPNKISQYQFEKGIRA
jgi:hypothetical protein